MSLSNNSLPEQYSGKYVESYAYITIKDRLPVILTKVIDSLCREKHNIHALYGEDAKEETKDIIGRLSALQNEMVTNKPIKPLVYNSPDTKIWNDYLEEEKKRSDVVPAWYDSAWLYVECYMYRRIKEAFELSTKLKDYDPFKQQKEESFLLSTEAVASLAKFLENALKEIGAAEDEKLLRDYFFIFIEVMLWGNKCDLSLSAGKQNVQLSGCLMSQLTEMRENILINDTQIIWDILQEANKKFPGEVRIDLILDNSGFELFGDLCFLHFLKTTKLVNKIHLYVKTIPWFVSDTLDVDIEWLLEMLSNSDNPFLMECSKQWTDNLKQKIWIIEKEIFWTSPHSYCEMKDINPELYSKLSQSNLLIFKGDLNYRKLLSDRQWDDTTSFITALQGFVPSSLVALRTIKADIIAGLENGVGEKMDSISKNWRYTGEYALIQSLKSV